MCIENIIQDWPHAGHKTSLGKFKKIKILSSIFSDHNAIIFEMKYKKKKEKKKAIENTNIWQLNNMLWNNQWITKEIKEKIIIITLRGKWKWKHNNPKSMGCRKRSSSFQIYLFSDQISRSVVSDSSRPHESQHARSPCPSPTPGVHSDSCPSSQWCHPAISSSVVPFSSFPQSLPASETFPMSQLFSWGG